MISSSPLHRSVLIVLLVLYSSERVKGQSNHSESIKVVDWDVENTEGYLFIGCFILIVSLGKLAYRRMQWLASYIPESLLLIIFGIGAGLICKYVLKDVKLFHLTPTLFFLILLPPIILDSAYHMYNRTFGDIFGIVLIMAVFGTIFCFFMIGFSLYGLEITGAMGDVKPTNESIMSLLLFSSLIVAVDPVAVLAIFKDIGVDRELYYMIFGESLLNDAVTVVLYEIMKAFISVQGQKIKFLQIFLACISFLTVSGGGLLIGVLAGVLSSLLTRIESHSSIHCITLFSSAYLSYLLANSLKWSGIISIIGCGIVQAAYAFKNIHSSSLSTLKEFMELIAGINEAIIFIFLGLELFMNDLVWHFGFQIWSIVMCLISRFIVFLVLRICINYVRVDQRKISWTELFVTTYGGLRGAVAFSLASLIEIGSIVKDNPTEDERIRGLFLTTTLIIILFTVGFMGPTMKPLTKFLEVKIEGKTTLSLYNELNNAVVDSLMSMIEFITLQRGRNRFRMFLSNLDNRYIKPLLMNDPFDNNSFKILKRYKQITLALHNASTNKNTSEQYLAEIPQSLWPKPLRKKSNVTIKKSITNILRKISTTKVSNKTLDPLNDEIEFISLFEMNHANRLKDMVHRKVSFQFVNNKDILSLDYLAPSNRTMRAYTTPSQRNLGFIPDEGEEELKTNHVSRV